MANNAIEELYKAREESRQLKTKVANLEYEIVELKKLLEVYSDKLFEYGIVLFEQ